MRSGLYRRDIDGLRAVAVLAVVGFHAGIPALRGGFIGVDIFFVISGYLICGIIFESLRGGGFSFSEFYVRRINRIFPALILVLSCTLVAGWVVLFDAEYVALARHIIGGSTFTSNFILWKEVGYFDLPTKPLLHLWSLAVEEQFYLTWPVLALVAWQRRWNIRITIAAVIAVSFILNVWAVRHGQATAAFYSPVTRFWEILAGGLLAFAGRQAPPRSHAEHHLGGPSREVLCLTGLSMIVIALVRVNATTPWPGIWALAPVLGACSVIYSGPHTVSARYILGNRVAVFVGLISYPLYLWHWPLIVFAKIVEGGQPSPLVVFLMIVTAFGLSIATFFFLERPVRFGRNKPTSAKLLFIVLALVCASGLLTLRRRIPPRLHRYSDIAAAVEDRVYLSGGLNRSGQIVDSRIPGDSAETAIFIGDSHMEHYWPRFVEMKKNAGQSTSFPTIRFMTNDGCPPLPGVNRVTPRWDGAPYDCNLYYSKAIRDVIQGDAAVVVFGAYWESYLVGSSLYLVGDPSKRPLGPGDPRVDQVFSLFEADLASIKKAGKTIFIVLSNPTSPAFDPKTMLPGRLPGQEVSPQPKAISRGAFVSATITTTDRLKKLAKRVGATTIDPVDYMCSRVVCSTVFADGSPIYSDANHLRAMYARRNATFMDATVTQFSK